METIIVGVDGSDGSRAALGWAFAEAAQRKARVVALSVWQFPYMALGPSPIGGTIVPTDELQATSESSLAAILADVGVPDGVDVTQVAKEGSASQTLLGLAESEGASLLVIGARGHGGFAGLLLGSVATQCVNHATVPTVVVPAAAAAARAKA
jgi:nucleotide-binding universal stress UspA family protein